MDFKRYGWLGRQIGSKQCTLPINGLHNAKWTCSGQIHTFTYCFSYIHARGNEPQANASLCNQTYTVICFSILMLHPCKACKALIFIEVTGFCGKESPQFCILKLLWVQFWFFIKSAAGRAKHFDQKCVPQHGWHLSFSVTCLHVPWLPVVSLCKSSFCAHWSFPSYLFSPCIATLDLEKSHKIWKSLSCISWDFVTFKMLVPAVLGVGASWLK